MTTIPAQSYRIPSLPALAIAMLAGCGGGGVDCPPGGAPCGTSYDVTSPTAVASSQTFATVSIGNWHTCMTSTIGAAWCWGSNDNGQLGAASAQRCMGGNIDCSAVPLAVGGMQAFVGIASSSVHSCGLTAAGAAWCWGIAAQLGDGGAGSGAVRVSVAVAGGHAFCAFEAEGSPWCWGSGFSFGTKGPTQPSTLPLQVLRPGVSSIRSVGFDEAGNAVLRAGSRHRLDRASLVFIDTFDAAPSRRRRRAGEIHGCFADVRGRTIAATAYLGLAFHVVLRWR
jgi:hypothetical protein